MNYSLFVPDEEANSEVSEYYSGFNAARFESIKKLEQNLPAHDAKIREEVTLELNGAWMKDQKVWGKRLREVVREEVLEEVEKKLGDIYSEAIDPEEGDPPFESYENGTIETLEKIKEFINEIKNKE
jgi:hypothetical protein